MKNIKSAFFAALLTGIMIVPIFGLQLERKGINTEIVPHWSIVLWGMAIVFVVQLLKPYVFRKRPGVRFNLPRVPSLNPKSSVMLLGLVFVVAVIWPFFSGRSQVDIATLVLIYVMLALGLNIVVGFAGLLDLGFVGFYAVGAYTYALLYHWAGWGFWEALPVAGVMSAFFGFLLGFPVLRLRGDYLAIVTLGFG